MKAEDIPSTNATAAYNYIGAGTYCVVAENSLNVTCDVCRVNCMDPSKNCPSDCHCFW